MLGLIPRLILITGLLSLSQCYWSDPPPQDTIVFGLSSEPKTLDPRFSTDANGQRINGLIFSSLVKRDKDLKLVGDLASSWSYANKVYRFELKPGIRFHDDQMARAEDFLYTFEQYQSARSPFSAQLKLIKKVECTYEASRGGELKLFLKDFSAPLITDLTSVKLLPAKNVQQTGDDFYRHPIGSGPYRFKSRDIKNIFLEKFTAYYGTQGVTKNLQFKIIKDSNTRFQKMYKGKIDIIQSDIPFSKVSFFEKQPNFKVVVAPGLSTTYILLNLRNPILNQQKVRLAISSSIDRNQLIKYTHEGYAEPATSIVTRASEFFNPHLSYQHMSEDEIRQTFAELNNEKIILKTSNTQEAIENGKVITQKLRQYGLNVEQQTYEWGTYYEDVRTGKFEMAIMKWVGIQDPDIYRISLHSKMVPPGRNRGYYNNAKFDSLVIDGLKEPDPEKRREIYNKAQEIVFSELPTIPLWYEKQVAIIHKRVKGYELPMSGNFSALTKVYKENATN